MRVTFMGTPEFSVPTLKALIASDHEVVAVYSQPPKPSGRGYRITKSPVHHCAESHNIPVFTPLSLRNKEASAEFASHHADIAVVVAYGLILPQSILEIPPVGCVNIHASLLPRWRGAAPIHRAIEAGDKESGITLMQMDVGLDTGDMLQKGRVDIQESMTSSDLHDHLSRMGAEMIVPLLNRYPDWKPESQNEDEVTYAHKLEKSESSLDFSQGAEILGRKIRAFTPWPGTTFTWKDRVVKVKKAAVHPDRDIPAGTIHIDQRRLFIGCRQGALELLILQMPSKNPMAASDVIHGYAMATGDMVS